MSCEISGCSKFSYAVTHLVVLKFYELVKLISQLVVDSLFTAGISSNYGVAWVAKKKNNSKIKKHFLKISLIAFLKIRLNCVVDVFGGKSARNLNLAQCIQMTDSS